MPHACVDFHQSLQPRADRATGQRAWSAKMAVMLKFDRVWEDREIHFDVADSVLKPRPGEVVIDKLEQVEDTKGNNGERGRLKVTNLRIIWESAEQSRINLSIGYKCIVSISNRCINSKLAGQSEALYLFSKFQGTQYEFIFTYLVPGSPRLFATVQSVYRSYQTTRKYREVKLRGAILENRELSLLPLEQMYDQVHGVFNLSNDQGSPGTLVITNVRVVWYADMNVLYNISIPYLQMKRVLTKDSKFGLAMVLETSEEGGGYVLGFHMDPPDKLKDTVKEIDSLRRVFRTSPIFGVEYEFESAPDSLDHPASAQEGQLEEGDEVIDKDHKSDAFALYCVDGAKVTDRGPVYSQELGLAIEKLPSGVTLADLWSVT